MIGLAPTSSPLMIAVKTDTRALRPGDRRPVGKTA